MDVEFPPEFELSLSGSWFSTIDPEDSSARPFSWNAMDDSNLLVSLVTKLVV